MMANIVELRKIGEQKLSNINTEIGAIEEQVDEKVGTFRDRKRRVKELRELCKQRGRMAVFLEILAEFRKIRR